MINCFKITFFSSTVKPIQISEDGSDFIPVRSYIRNNFSKEMLASISYYAKEDGIVDYEYTADNIFKDMPNYLRKLLEDDEEGYEINEEENEEDDDSTQFIIDKDYVISSIEYIYNTINNLSAPVIIEENSFYHLGWKQLYNNYVYLDINQKCRELNLFSETYTDLDFYPLDRLISLLKSDDTEFTMTSFAFTLFSATKSLYKAPKNRFVKDIRLSVLADDEIINENACHLIEQIVESIVQNSIFFDYANGKPNSDPIKQYNIRKAESNYYNDEDDENYANYMRKIKHTYYNVDYVDYPIIVKKSKRIKHNPNKVFHYTSASPIFINYIDTSANKKSMYIPVYPQSNNAYTENAPRTGFLSFLESKLSSIADDKFKSKGILSDLSQEITDIITQPHGGYFGISPKEMVAIEKCIFGLCFHKNQKITYFDDLYNKAKKQLSFPDSDPDKVKTYSYLLASLMSFKEYVDQLPKKNYLLEIAYSLIEDDEDSDCYAENSSPPKPPITDITSYKKDFYTLFDQTVEIFKKRCAVNDTADHTISYEDKLILYFEQFITELQSERSELIIPPSKEKQGLIFLNFHSYFEHFELFLEKKNFHYTISKQKFNRLLFDNKILKPRYNGNDKTPPKFDYILQVNDQKYTVLAIKLEMLKCKCDELSKCP